MPRCLALHVRPTPVSSFSSFERKTEESQIKLTPLFLDTPPRRRFRKGGYPRSLNDSLLLAATIVPQALNAACFFLRHGAADDEPK